MAGLRRHADRIRFVLVHHEEAAAFMACAYAKVTGKLGVCLATSGPGGIHLLNGLYDAKGFAEAFLRGEPDKLDTVKTIVRDQIDKLRS